MSERSLLATWFALIFVTVGLVLAYALVYRDAYAAGYASAADEERRACANRMAAEQSDYVRRMHDDKGVAP